MQALSKLSSYVCNKSFVMFPTVMNSLSVGVFSCKRIAPQLPPLWRDSPSSTGQRKVRLSEGRPILVTFHLSLVLVGATNIFSELIHPLLKLPNCVLKQQLQILQLSEALGSAFSLFEKQEQALSAYCHFHPLMFDLPENTTLYTETTLSPHLPYVFGHVRLTSLLLRCSYPTLNQFWKKTDCFAV